MESSESGQQGRIAFVQSLWHREHADHERFFGDHFQVKGREVAEACTETVAALGRLPVAS